MNDIIGMIIIGFLIGVLIALIWIIIKFELIAKEVSNK